MRDRFYELGNAIGNRRTLEYLGEDVRETGRDFRDIAQGLYRAGRWAARNAKNILVQTLAKGTYPITGNLSYRVRERIEEVVGQNVFNSKHAAITSYVTNMILYPLIIEYTLLHGRTGILGLAFVGVMSGNEIMIRKDNQTFSRVPAGSFLGKIVSLPIEAGMSIYDGIKQAK